LNGYYSVFNPRGEKIADCGSQKDAVTLLNMRNNRWEGHYYTFNPLPGDIIDVSSGNQLPPNQQYVGWQHMPEKEFDVMFPDQKLSTQQSLPENQQQPLDL